MSSPDPFADQTYGEHTAETYFVSSFDGTQIACTSIGDPALPAIVLCHGLTLNRNTWHHQLADIDGFRLIAYDARGHGASGPAEGPSGTTQFNPRSLAADLAAVINSSGVTDCIVVGHSMGGMTAQALAEFGHEHPVKMGEVIRGVVLICTTFTGQLGLWRRGHANPGVLHQLLIGGWSALATQAPRLDRVRVALRGDLATVATRIGFGAAPSPTHIDWTTRMAAECPTSTIAAAVTGLANFDTHAILADIDVPAIVIAGTRDVLTPLHLAREMAHQIPESELVVFQGCGHMAMYERADEVTQIVQQFAEKRLG